MKKFMTEMVLNKKSKNLNTYYTKKYKSDLESIKITSSNQARNLAVKIFENSKYDNIEIYESFYVIFLNRANITTGFIKISQGGIAGTVVDLKLIMKCALDTLAQGIILIHNHPSGNLEPSNPDIEITNKIKKASEMLEINLLDHLILTANGHYSFADQNKL
jgi:DNA repair protein RadC